MVTTWRLSQPTLRSLKWWAGAAIFVVLLSFWFNAAYYTLKKERREWDLSLVKVRMFAPKFLSAGDDEQIRFSIENSAAQSVDVAVRLTNSGPLQNLTNLSQNNEVYLGSIKGGEQIYRQANLFVPSGVGQLNQMRHREIGLSISEEWLIGSPQSIPLPIHIAPIPRAKWLSYNLGIALAGLILWFTKELWDLIGEQSR